MLPRGHRMQTSSSGGLPLVPPDKVQYTRDAIGSPSAAASQQESADDFLESGLSPESYSYESYPHQSHHARTASMQPPYAMHRRTATLQSNPGYPHMYTAPHQEAHSLENPEPEPFTLYESPRPYNHPSMRSGYGPPAGYGRHEYIENPAIYGVAEEKPPVKHQSTSEMSAGPPISMGPGAGDAPSAGTGPRQGGSGVAPAYKHPLSDWSDMGPYPGPGPAERMPLNRMVVDPARGPRMDPYAQPPYGYPPYSATSSESVYAPPPAQSQGIPPYDVYAGSEGGPRESAYQSEVGVQSDYGEDVEFDWDGQDVNELMKLLEIGERFKWRYASDRLFSETGQWLPAVACQKKFNDLFGCKEGMSKLKTSLFYIVYRSGWDTIKNQVTTMERDDYEGGTKTSESETEVSKFEELVD